MAKKFDYEGAKNAGYSDDEIMSHLSQIHQDFNINAAREAGYSSQEINQHLSTYQPKRSVAAKGGRLAMQAGLSVAERVLLPYEVAVAPLASKEAQHAEYRKNVFEDIERLLEQKQTGVWDEADQKLYDNLVEQIKHPEKAEKFVKTADIGVRGLIQKATGIETRPEGALEKAINWTAFIKKPSNAKALIKIGSSPKQIIKSILPSPEEALRGLGAGTALQMAEEEKFGPIGSMSAAIVGDLIGGHLKGAPKRIGRALISPKETAARTAGTLTKFFTNEEKLALQRQIIQDFRDNGIQADIGTITNSPLIQSIQAKLAASGLTGEVFENFKNQLTQQIQEQYKKVADTLGESRFNTIYEANELGKDFLTKIRDTDLAEIRELYKGTRELGKGKTAVLGTPKLATKIAELETEMAPGAIKSPSSKKVLDELEKLKTDLYDTQGNLKPASIEALINNKINLNDIVDYDVQGGAKKLLQGVIGEIDRALKEYGATQDKDFLKKYLSSNERFKEHAKLFRNETLNKILTSEDPSHLLKRMDSIQGIKDIRKAFIKTAEGKDFFDELARLKMDEMIQKNMIDGTTNQIKLGTFSNILEKGKNREIIRELLSPEAYKQLVKLQKNTGKLYNSAQKFYNSSKSGTTVIDAKLLNNIINMPIAIAGVLSGNYWAAAPYATIGAMKLLSKFMTDPKFLRIVEDVILAGEKNNTKLMQRAADALVPYAQEIAPAVASAEKQNLE